MSQWRAEVGQSHIALVLSSGWHGLVVFGLLVLPPPSVGLVFWILAMLVIIEFQRSRRRWSRCHGVILWWYGRQWEWCEHEWQLIRRPFLLGPGCLLILRGSDGQICRLWLMRDSMEEGLWRALRQFVFSGQLWQVDIPDTK